MVELAITEYRHGFHFELPFDESDLVHFAPYECCPCCHSNRDSVVIVELGQQAWRKRVQVVQCPDCELLYYGNPPAENFIADYYSRIWNKNTGEDTSKSARPSRKIARATARLASDLGLNDPQTTFLDVGCGLGRHMAGLVEAGFPNVWGTEMSEFRLAASAARFPGQIFRGGWEAVPEDHSFDMIYTNHVAEHLYQPLVAIQNLVERLNAGGLLALTVPDARAEPVLNQILFLPHLHSFNHRALQRMAEAVGRSCLFWLGARPWELAVVYYKTMPTGIRRNRFKTAEEMDVNAAPEQSSRLRAAFPTIAGDGRTLTMRATYKSSDATERDYGFLALNGFAKFKMQLAWVAHDLLKALRLKSLARRCVKKQSYMTVAARGGTEALPMIFRQDGKIVFHIK